MIIKDGFQLDPDHPFRRYKKVFGGGGGKVKAPAPTAPAPTPTEIDEDVRRRDMDRRRQRIAAAGRQGTILTQGQSLASGNATILGRSTA